MGGGVMIGVRINSWLIFSTFLATTEAANVVEKPEQQQQNKKRTSAQSNHKSMPIHLEVNSVVGCESNEV